MQFCVFDTFQFVSILSLLFENDCDHVVFEFEQADCTLSLSGPPSGYDGGHGIGGRGGYGGASAEAPNVTTKEQSELFGGIGQVIFYIFSFELLAFKFS